MISLPFQNNTFFGAGANHDKTANVLNIQPVLPFNFGDWNIISRTIAPLIALPSLTAADLGEVITAGPSSNDPFGLGDINQTLIQPFVNYNMPDGWYAVSAPIITANWSVPSEQRWSVPIGGGGGKIFKIGDQPMNASTQAFDYVAHPSLASRWALRFQLQFLFPK
jgi:hypothetical protein